MAAWPEQFSVFYGGELGGARLTRLPEPPRCLLYERYNRRGYERLLEPDEAEWCAFWETFEQVGVWSWPRHYEPVWLATDGVWWEIEIVYQQRQVVSSGYNVWPPGVFPEISPEWAAFCGAVSRLAGGEPFHRTRWTSNGLEPVDPWRGD